MHLDAVRIMMRPRFLGELCRERERERPEWPDYLIQNDYQENDYQEYGVASYGVSTVRITRGSLRAAIFVFKVVVGWALALLSRALLA